MPKLTGLSGNEIYCLAEKGFEPGHIVVGNSVHSLGIIGSIGSGLKSILGGELTQVTQIIEDGRKTAFDRLQKEANDYNAIGVTGVDSQLINHGSNVEFLAIGSSLHANKTLSSFTTSADGQELYAQLDLGFTPISFAFGNVAYSIGVGRGILGALKTFGRGEIKEYSDIFNKTRHLALQRIIESAKEKNANAVVGIRTSILSFGNASEMLMVGTASHHMNLDSEGNDPITSDLTNIEMWSMAKKGYRPHKLLLGTSVYSLGLIGGISSALKSFARGEINELTRMIYDARENALAIIADEAKQIGADDVVGIKTYVYQLGNGLIEFLAIGTAVKKDTQLKPATEQLPAQAVVFDKETFVDASRKGDLNVNMNQSSKTMRPGIPWVFILIVLAFVIYHLFVAT